jgi:LCP family protein required for cell wall assembly
MATIAPPPPRARRTSPSGSSRPPTSRTRRPMGSVAETRAQAAALRRALLMMLATVVVPGSAQRLAGNKQIGRISLRIWLGLLMVLALVALVGTQRPTVLVSLASNDSALTAIKIVMAVLGAGWLFLILDAWRLGRPPALSRRGRLGLTATAGMSFLLVAGLISTGMHLLDVQRELVGSVFATGPALGTVDGRYNVLVVGGDAGRDREGMRADSLTVASVDAETGESVLIGIPRNLMDAPFPEGTKLAERWPQGFDCGDECIISSLNTWANDPENEEWTPGASDKGLEATRLAVEGVTGLQIPYTAVVDMGGFQRIVDALGGVTVDVGKRTVIGGGTGPIEGYIEPGVQKLNGYQALWFARSREGTSDYERMVRQKCLTSSLARQADPITVLRNYESLAKASADIIETDIPTNDLPGLLSVARLVPSQPINAISLVPPLVEPATPEFDEIHAMVQGMLNGEPAFPATSDGGDGSVGNAGSSASAASQGSVPAWSGSTGEEANAAQGSESGKNGAANGKKNNASAKGATAAELGLVCQPV